MENQNTPEKLIIFLGRSCTGKTTTAEMLCKLLNLKKFDTYTTRAKRTGEGDDEYTFLSIEEFKKLEQEGHFLESSVVKGEGNQADKYYGMGKLIHPNTLALLTVEGAEKVYFALKNTKIKIFTVLFDITEENSKNLMTLRDPNISIKDIISRANSDTEDLKKLTNVTFKPNIVLNGNLIIENLSPENWKSALKQKIIDELLPELKLFLDDR